MRIVYGFSNRDILHAIFIGFAGGLSVAGLIATIAWVVFYG